VYLPTSPYGVTTQRPTSTFSPPSKLQISYLNLIARCYPFEDQVLRLEHATRRALTAEMHVDPRSRMAAVIRN
jgi:hypothetical protein